MQAFTPFLANTPERTTAAAFPRYLHGRILADSAALHWSGPYVRRFLCHRVVDWFLVPATAEPLISCGVAGSAEFRERAVGEHWVTRYIRRGGLFVTRSKTPYEVSFRSPVGQELEIVQVHVAIEPFLAALNAVYADKADEVEVIDFAGRDEALAHLCYACAAMLAVRTPGSSRRVADLTQLFASFLAENYTKAACKKPNFRSGLPIRPLRKVEDSVSEQSRRGYFSRGAGSGGGLESLPLFPGVQANHGQGSASIRDPLAHAARPAAHPRNLAQLHRDRAGSRLHEPEPFCSGVPTSGRDDADRVRTAL
jgi:hypothetical protein